LSSAQSYADGLVSGIETVTEDFVRSLVDGVQAVANDAQALATEAKEGVDYVASTLADMITNFDSWVQSSIEWLLDFWIETEDESEEYKKGGV